MLPIDAVRGQIKNILKESDTAIFIGETGSGKSTQLPQVKLFTIFNFFIFKNI